MINPAYPFSHAEMEERASQTSTGQGIIAFVVPGGKYAYVRFEMTMEWLKEIKNHLHEQNGNFSARPLLNNALGTFENGFIDFLEREIK